MRVGRAAVPVVVESSYRPPWWCRSARLQTCWPSLVRRLPALPWSRERLELDDGDFLDLDWCRAGADRLLVISHGLEGSSRRNYVSGLAHAAVRRGWSVLAWNFRGCSGEPNRLARSYHSGATEDLAAVVRRATASFGGVLGLAGFSLGGNLTLKFLGEDWPELRSVRAGVTLSVPCDLKAAAGRMAAPDCAFYMRRFLREMGAKMDAKRARFGPAFPAADWRTMRTFAEFDEAFTAPLHGFASAEDYWACCSAVRFLPAIRVPTLILNAADDPFLAPPCFPVDLALASPFVTLEMPRHGGHVGFAGGGIGDGEYWSEQRIMEFLEIGSRNGEVESGRRARS